MKHQGQTRSETISMATFMERDGAIIVGGKAIEFDFKIHHRGTEAQRFHRENLFLSFPLSRGICFAACFLCISVPLW
jgi:hypothetical protein